MQPSNLIGREPDALRIVHRLMHVHDKLDDLVGHFTDGTRFFPQDTRSVDVDGKNRQLVNSPVNSLIAI